MRAVQAKTRGTGAEQIGGFSMLFLSSMRRHALTPVLLPPCAGLANADHKLGRSPFARVRSLAAPQSSGRSRPDSDCLWPFYPHNSTAWHACAEARRIESQGQAQVTVRSGQVAYYYCATSHHSVALAPISLIITLAAVLLQTIFPRISLSPLDLPVRSVPTRLSTFTSPIGLGLGAAPYKP